MTLPPISAECMAVYRASARNRQQQRSAALHDRHQLGLAVAKQAAALLKQAFGVQQVAVFGSLVHGRWFSKTSDVDLAVWGLGADDYFVAVSRLQDLSPEFKVDLVDMERCSPALKQAVLQTSQPL